MHMPVPTRYPPWTVAIHAKSHTAPNASGNPIENHFRVVDLLLHLYVCHTQRPCNDVLDCINYLRAVSSARTCVAVSRGHKSNGSQLLGLRDVCLLLSNMQFCSVTIRLHSTDPRAELTKVRQAPGDGASARLQPGQFHYKDSILYNI